MLAKLIPFLALAVTVAFAQNQVRISGTVRNNASNTPISGVAVKLLGKNLSATTDASGAFVLSNTGTTQPQAVRQSGGISFSAEHAALIIRGAAGCKVSLHDLSGKTVTAYSGEQWTGAAEPLRLPVPTTGVYLCRITAGNKVRTIPFVATRKGRVSLGIADADGNSHVAMGAVPKAVDTLFFTKNGYVPLKMPIDTLVKEGLNILLTDSSSNTDVTIVPDPSWTCFMPNGIPPPERGVAAFTITLQYSAVHNVGLTKFGNRRQYDISGGSVTGSKLTATVLSGGLDYELTLSNGSMEVEQIIILRAGTTPILMRNAGVAPAGGAPARVVLDFEAPNSSSYTWLHSGKFAANRIINTSAKTITLAVYDITNTALTANRIQIKDPPDVTNQTWDCLSWSGSQGATVFTENVTLGSSISIGASKRGNRNIIPITGGTTSGKVTGKILPGGADYQLGGLDARYTLAPNDGEFIIVRNCGAGALVPVFEARVDGPYAFLNENKYLSSSPGMGSGGVTITFYEKR